MRVEHRPDQMGEPTHVIIDDENGFSITIRRLGGTVPAEPGILTKYIMSAAKAAVNWVASWPGFDEKNLWS